MGIEQYSELLMGLRKGEVSFEEVRRKMDGLLRRRAHLFCRQWQQTLESPEDLVQVMALALWKAVDEWDPSLPNAVDLTTWVNGNLGRKALKALRKPAGNPDPRRSKPIKQVGASELLFERQPSELPDAEEVMLQRETAAVVSTTVLSHLSEGLARTITLHVLEGGTVEEAALAIYANPSLRLRYRLDSRAHAVKVAHNTAYRVQVLARRLAEESARTPLDR